MEIARTERRQVFGSATHLLASCILIPFRRFEIWATVACLIYVNWIPRSRIVCTVYLQRWQYRKLPIDYYILSAWAKGRYVGGERYYLAHDSDHSLVLKGAYLWKVNHNRWWHCPTMRHAIHSIGYFSQTNSILVDLKLLHCPPTECRVDTKFHIHSVPTGSWLE
jgi:hypothetical protein